MNPFFIGTMLKLGGDGVNDYIDFMARCGMNCCQLCRVSGEYMDGGENNLKSRALLEKLEQSGIRPVSVFLFYRERSAGNGFVTPELRAERFAYAFRQMVWGTRNGIKLFTAHAGYFPEVGSPDYERFILDMRALAQFAGDLGGTFLFETGPESVEVLEQTIRDIGETNVGINFDPANLLLYNKTDPMVFANHLFDRIRLIHCKDGKRPHSGERLGLQTPLGEGDTDFAHLIRFFLDRNFSGPLIIEREIPIGPAHFEDQTKAFHFLQEATAAYGGK